MKRLVLWCVILLCPTPLPTTAAVNNLEAKLTEVKKNLTVEEQVNIELKAHLAARETEVAEARVKLKQIEDRIDALKKEHPMETK